MERTLILLKPDAVQRGLVGEIVARFEKAGIKIIGLKMVLPDDEHYHHHYETIGKIASRRSQEIYQRNSQFMKMGPVVAAVLEGVEVIEQVRKMAGDTEPKAAQPGTIRGDYAHLSYDHVNKKSLKGLANVLHASADAADAKLEIAHWFKPEELFEYKLAHEHFTLQNE